MLVLYYKIYEAAKRVVDAELKSQASCSSVQPLALTASPTALPLARPAGQAGQSPAGAPAASATSTASSPQSIKSSVSAALRLQRAALEKGAGDDCHVCGRSRRKEPPPSDLHRREPGARSANACQPADSTSQPLLHRPLGADGCAGQAVSASVEGQLCTEGRLMHAAGIAADLNVHSSAGSDENGNLADRKSAESPADDPATVELVGRAAGTPPSKPANRGGPPRSSKSGQWSRVGSADRDEQPAGESRLSRSLKYTLPLRLDSEPCRCDPAGTPPAPEGKAVSSADRLAPAFQRKPLPPSAAGAKPEKSGGRSCRRSMQLSASTHAVTAAGNPQWHRGQRLLPSGSVTAGAAATAAGQRRLHSSLRERKASITLGVIMCAFLCCWLPFFILALIRPFASDRIPDWASSLCLWLGYVNSMLNPIIYVTFHQDFRRAFKYILLCRCKVMKSSMRKEAYNVQYG